MNHAEMKERIEFLVKAKTGMKIMNGVSEGFAMIGFTALFCDAFYLNPDKQETEEGRNRPETIALTTASSFSIERQIKTLFHELGHATGRANRLNRPVIRQISDCLISRATEEMIAETTSANLMEYFGLDSSELWSLSVEYIEREFLFIPTSMQLATTEYVLKRAKEATDFILNNWLNDLLVEEPIAA